MATIYTDAAANKRVEAVRDATSVEDQRYASRSLCDGDLIGEVTWTIDVAAVLTTALREWEDQEAKEDCMHAISLILGKSKELMPAFAEAGIFELLMALLPHYMGNDCSVVLLLLNQLTLNSTVLAQQLRDLPGVMEALEAQRDAQEDGCVDTWVGTLLARLGKLSSTGRMIKPARAG